MTTSGNDALKATVNDILKAHGNDGRPMSYREAGEKTDLSHTLIAQMAKNGHIPQREKLKMFADGFKMRRVPIFLAAGLLPDESDRESDAKNFPSTAPHLVQEDLHVKGHVPCGGTELKEEEEGFTLSEMTDGDFILVAQGPCLEPHIFKGDFLVVRQRPAELGEVVLFNYEGESSCKVLTGINLVDDRTVYTLTPTKEGFEEIISADVEIRGVVVEVLNRKRLGRIAISRSAAQ